jgi:hypothetical protein
MVQILGVDKLLRGLPTGPPEPRGPPGQVLRPPRFQLASATCVPSPGGFHLSCLRDVAPIDAAGHPLLLVGRDVLLTLHERVNSHDSLAYHGAAVMQAVNASAVP